MYLVDTNIWLERLLDQERAGEVAHFLASVESKKLAVTDFSIHSIAIIMTRLNKNEDFLLFVDDLFLSGDCKLVTLSPVNFKLIIDSIDEFKLDFDDSYQYVSAKIHKYQLITFDNDFQNADITVKEPKEINH